MRFYSTSMLLVAVLACGCGNKETPPNETDTSDSGKSNTQKSESNGKPTKNKKVEVPPYHNPLSEEQIDEGWISLFDGHTLYGWQHETDVNWSVADGAITADSGPIGLLKTKVPFSDFELRLQYRAEANANSGIFIRCKEEVKSPETDAYEVNIADSHPQGFTTGAVVGIEKATAEVKTTGDEKWHTVSITANGPKVIVVVDDLQVLTMNNPDSTRLSGFIGLQKNSGKIEFKDIMLQPLDSKPLFDGKSLAGWNEVPGGTSKFSVEDGTIHVVDGAGFLETEGTYDDFLFQCQAKTHAAELNSGIFFRAMKGTEETPSHGYEAQIHNGFDNDDRTKPNNAGTGAIFRRTTARRVVSSDNEWFTMTLVAFGPQISVWVNGYQVTDWIDEREPNENPRKGLRTNAGHFSLQGHDPTTDLSFRKLQIVELPAVE